MMALCAGLLSCARDAPPPAVGRGDAGPAVEAGSNCRREGDFSAWTAMRWPAATDDHASHLPSILAVADLNRDGWGDVLNVQGPSQELRGKGVTVSLNVGGRLAAPEQYGDAADPGALVIDDLDGDGALDCILTDAATGSPQFLAGTGSGTFAPAAVLRAGVALGPALIAVRLRSAALVDVVAATAAREIVVGLNDGAGRLSFSPPIAAPDRVSRLQSCDINGDGVPDVVASGAGGRWLAFFVGDGRGQLHLLSTLEMTFAASAAGDLDGDQRCDLVVTSDRQARWLAGAGDGSFASRALVPTTGTAQEIALVDFDGDGDSDLLFGGLTLELAVNDGRGGFSVHDASAAVPAPFHATPNAAFLTRSCVADLLSSSGDQIWILSGGGR